MSYLCLEQLYSLSEITHLKFKMHHHKAENMVF